MLINKTLTIVNYPVTNGQEKLTIRFLFPEFKTKFLTDTPLVFHMIYAIFAIFNRMTEVRYIVIFLKV